jgi:hypothetical protein
VSNEYFDWPSRPTQDRLVRFDTVRSADLNNMADLVSAGFEKLPIPASLWGGKANYAADTVAANAYVVSIAATYLTSYVTGMQVKFRATNTNTGASTINVNGLGAKAIVRPDGATALTAGAIMAGQIVTLEYDGNAFQMPMAGDVTWSNDPGAIQKQDYIYFTTGGTSNAYTLTPTPALSGAYEDGTLFAAKFHTANAAVATIDISGRGVLTLKKWTPAGLANLEANDILADQTISIMVSGTSAIVMSPITSSGMRHSKGFITLASTSYPVTWGATAAPYITRFSCVLNDISTNGTSPPVVRMLTGGGAASTGYSGSWVQPGNGVATVGSSNSPATANTGVPISATIAAASKFHSRIEGELADAATNTWQICIVTGMEGTGVAAFTTQKIELGAGNPATGFSLTTTGGVDTFDGGKGRYDIFY